MAAASSEEIPQSEVSAPIPHWIDVVEPDGATASTIREKTGLRIPTLDELSEIVSSSRLYVENGAVYVSVPVISSRPSGEPVVSPLGLIIAKDWFITVRYGAVPGIEGLARRVGGADPAPNSVDLYLQFTDSTVDSVADQLEAAGTELDRVSLRIFHERAAVKLTRLDAELRATLREIGQISQRVTKLNDELLVVGRSIPFVQANAPWAAPESAPRFRALRTDTRWLIDHAGHVAGQVQFLQEATIGFIGIEQSHIIKVLAVVATVGVPPTLLASIWGMNFEQMPELKWEHGYLLAWATILISGLIPLAWFKRAGWL